MLRARDLAETFDLTHGVVNKNLRNSSLLPSPVGCAEEVPKARPSRSQKQMLEASTGVCHWTTIRLLDFR
eukprot:8043230-Pyramimonas_sp.AAC.1